VWSALIIKNQGTFEEKIQDTYPDKKIKVEWHDVVSGAVINNNMISGKYHIGFMGDMPAIINCFKSNTTDNYNSEIIASDGKGLRGSNQAVLISSNSTIESISDLKGKTVTVPVGSSSHRMLLDLLNSNNLMESVTIQHQDVTVSTTLLENEKVDAFAVWEPYCTYLLERGTARKLIDGSESNKDYLTGIIINSDWGNQNEDIVIAFMECLLEAHELFRDDSDVAAGIIEQESSFSKEIAKNIIGNTRWDAIIYQKDIDSMMNSIDFLSKIEVIDEYDIEDYINQSYLALAVNYFGLNVPQLEKKEWPDEEY